MRLVVPTLIVIAACSGPTEPMYEVPASGFEVELPSAYATWWAEVERDAGIAGDLGRIRLFAVPGPWYSQRYKRTIRGLWVPDGRIYIVESLLLREGLVKHEMLHEILRGDRTHAHPLFAVYDAPLFGLPAGP